MREVRQNALYGKGGIGKSTTSSNLSAALSKFYNQKVLQVGCDPKSDSTTTVMSGRLLPTILDQVRINGQTRETVMQSIGIGFNGIICAEAGGPRPGTGCAGKGVAVALELLHKFNILDDKEITFALYDVLGDVVCGGFAQPMRAGYAREIYLVSSGELMALYAANNISKAVVAMQKQGASVSVGGIIDNQRNVKGETDLMNEFADRLGVPIVAHIRRSPKVQEAEMQRKTVIELFPESDIGNDYKEVAGRILHNKVVYTPKPMEMDEILLLLNKHQLLVPA